MSLHSQRPTKEPCDPAKNLHNLKINNSQKMDCDPKTKMIHDVPEDKK